MNPRAAIVIWVAWFCWTGVVTAAELKARVKYLAKSSVYVDAGRLEGLTVGALGVLLREDQPFGELKVQFLADHSASCLLIASAEEPVVGDQALFSLQDAPAAPLDTLTTAKIAEPKVRTVTQLVERTRKERISELSGRIAVQYYHQDDRDEADFDYSQPSLITRLMIQNVQGSHLDLALRFRSRKIFRMKERSDATRSAWNNRFYEVSLLYNNADSRLGWGVGRIQNRYLSGAGYVDGAQVDFEAAEHWRLGIMGGSEPDAETSQINSDRTKYGAYAHYELDPASGRQGNSTLAVAGIYRKGEIDREFIYTQNNFTPAANWSIYQSAELNVNRGWRKDLVGKTLELSNLMVSLRWDPLKSLSLSTGYDNLKSVRDYDSRDVADSLFDDAARQGFRAGATLRLPWNLRVGLNGNLRSNDDGGSAVKSGSANLSCRDQWFTGATLNLRGNSYTNLYSHGHQVSVSGSRAFFDIVSTGVEYGGNHYELKNVVSSRSAVWWKFDLDVWLSRRLTTSAYFELTRGEGVNADRFFVDVGWRL